MSLYTDAVAELVAVGAAVAANCEPCLKFHYTRALDLGVSHEDLALAVATARVVKETPARHILAVADRLGGRTPVADESASIETCCATATAKKSCCGS